MCNDYGNRVPYSRYVEEFSHLKLPVFVRSNGPDLKPRDDIRIHDTVPIILRADDGVELTERVGTACRQQEADLQFSLREAQLPESTRCLVPASHFCEFTAPAERSKSERTNGDSRWRGLIGFAWPGSSARMQWTASSVLRSWRQNLGPTSLRITTAKWSSSNATIGARGST
jgi:hypothetical protein